MLALVAPMVAYASEELQMAREAEGEEEL